MSMVFAKQDEVTPNVFTHGMTSNIEFSTPNDKIHVVLYKMIVESGYAHKRCHAQGVQTQIYITHTGLCTKTMRKMHVFVQNKDDLQF